MSPAVAQAEQVSVAAFGDAVEGAEGSGPVVDAAHQGDIGGNGCFHLEAQVIQQLAVVIAECLFVQADVRVVADAFKETEAQPGLNPQPGADADNTLSEALGWKIGIGGVLVVFTTALLLGDVAEQIRLKFQG